MYLKFVGTGSAFSDDVNNSAYLKNEDNMLLIDCGETVFSTLKRSNVLDGVNNLYVFITHTHSDHIGSLSSLIHFMYYAKNKKVHILTADNYEIKNDIKKLLEINGNTSEQYDFENAKKVASDLNLKDITLCEVKHTPLLKCYAIEMTEKQSEKENLTIFTGDTCDIDYIMKSVKRKNLQNLYVDVSMYGGVHLPYELAVEKLSPYKDKVVFMHLENGFIKNRLIHSGFKYAKQSQEFDQYRFSL